MIELKSAARARELASMLPAVAVARMIAFEGEEGQSPLAEPYDPDAHGHLVVLEEGDKIEQLLPDYDPAEPPFEYVFSSWEGQLRVFEAAVPLAGDAMLVMIVPDAPWLDTRLRAVLHALAQEE